MLLVYIWIIVQLILEMVPVSSSGHLQLLEQFYKKFFSFNIETFFSAKKISIKSFYYFLHGLTLLVVLFFFKQQLMQLFFGHETLLIKPIIWMGIADSIILFFYILVSYYNISFGLHLGFLITSVSLLSTVWCNSHTIFLDWNYSHAIILGLAQSLAFLPGISRMAFTVAVGCWLNYSVMDAFFLSWLIQIPLMIGGSTKGAKELMQSNTIGEILNLPMVLVMIMGSGISWYILYIVFYTIKANTFYFFGWYMILPLAFWIWLNKKL